MLKALYSMNASEQGDLFPVTRHSVLSAACGSDPAQRANALDVLTASYWKPIYKYVRVRWGIRPEDAQDFTQDFFTRLIEKEFLGSYDPAKGHLRTFLRVCADRLFLNQSRDARRQKRGEGAAHVPLDFEEAEREMAKTAHAESPEEYFEKEWTRTLFALAVSRLRAQCDAAGKPIQFALFERYDLEESPLRPTYADLALEFGVAATDVTNYLAAARREFRRCVLHQLREMTGSEEEFQREAHSLLGVELK
ncbi:MAG TPA: sigma-70 family RNA polymerase sigma factor [Candidatus Angelobacter sp.]|nr:sigma-70 family RNA polymerase sigma factor [Candidatus Angelobacter sp.]